jgi:integrase
MPRSDAPRLCRVAGKTDWHIYHRRRRLTTGCKDRAEAEAVLAEYIAGEKKPKAAVTSISRLLADYLADRTERAIPGLERLTWAHKPLLRHFADKPITTITGATCRAYLRARLAEDVGPSTVRTELQALHAALNWAAKSGAILAMPVIELPPRPPPRQRWLTRAEADALIAACRAHHVRLFCIVALHTAARKSDILGLQWHRVDLDRRLVDFVGARTQTRKGRARVPINDTLHAALSEAFRCRETEYVIEYAGGPVASIKHGFGDACVRAGLTDVTPHTLRHTAATWMAQAGVSLWDIAGFLGHSNPQMVAEVYGHWSPDHLKLAAKALG